MNNDLLYIDTIQNRLQIFGNNFFRLFSFIITYYIIIIIWCKRYLFLEINTILYSRLKNSLF